jgi:hypothetical protein
MVTIIRLSALGVVTKFVVTLGVALLDCFMNPGADLCFILSAIDASRGAWHRFASIVPDGVPRLLLSSLTFQSQRRDVRCTEVHLC